MHYVLVALAACFATGFAARVTVSTDFGWRTAQATLSCVFPTPTGPGVQCQGLSYASDGNASATACAAAACSRRVAMWQWAPGRGGECWVGSPQPPLNCTAQGTDPEAWVGAYAPSSGGPPPPNAPEAQPSFDDSAWRLLDTPHDATVEGAYDKSANGGEGFLPSVQQWYRKHFFTPEAWRGQAVTLTLDASLSTSTFWLNGQQLVVARPSGYLPLSLRLDGAAGLRFGATNLFAAYVDGSETTGWWYEGSGLVRHSRLVVTPSDAYIAPSGVSAPAFVTGAYTAHGAVPADGLTGNATLSPSVDVSATASFFVAWRLITTDGAAVVATASAKGKGPSTVFAPPMQVTNAELWSVARPYLYTLETSITTAAGSLDAVNTSIGIRVITFDSERGMFVNEEAVKMRGFCSHESFTGVGGALPDRVDLFRLQQLRGVGGNSLRTSHDPYAEVMLDIADRLGVLILDENRVLATLDNCVGPKCQRVPAYAGDPAADVGALALRDRTHASIFAYSLCNEAGCGDGSLLLNDTVTRAKQAAYDYDGSRLVGANMGWLSPMAPRTPMSDALDIMGFSHASGEVIAAFHEREPARPLMMSECCSCEGQRGEDEDQPLNKSLVYYSDNTADCLHAQVSTSDTPEWMSGTFVWTIHDYMGEPGDWPHVSSSFGAIDLAGFHKASAAWFRATWLSSIPGTDAARPPIGGGSTTAYLVELWEPSRAGKSTRLLHVYTNAPFARVVINGKATAPAPVSVSSYATFNVTYAPGTVTAQGLAADGATVLASHSRTSWGTPARIELTVDVPSVTTGTGSAVYLDGLDVALVRATVVDSNGNVCADATTNITFAVTSGPGRVWGVGNGDPANQQPSHAPWRSAYHGLARAIVRVTLAATGSAEERALLAAVNVDAGASPESSAVLSGATPPPTALIISASAPGLTSGTVTVALSVDPADAVLAVASRSVGVADLTVV